MRFDAAIKKTLSWMTALAILMALVAPGITHAAGLIGGAAWIEVCSASGTRWVPMNEESGQSGLDFQGTHVLEHCPYCSVHSTAFAPPPTPLDAPRMLLLQSEVPALFLSAPSTLHAWRAAQSRAPPLAM
ncbi:DUF2946 domain-containing protein [Acidovorax sp. NCPPB 2350]|nr:DUF2946 domain-containing protein [Acidovorax sp. NCPPB 2350]